MASFTKKTAGIAAVAATAVLGLGIAGVARADDQGASTSTPAPTSTSSTDANRGMGDGGRMGYGRGHMGRGGMVAGVAADLAKKLGIEQSKVEDAIKAVRDDLKANRTPGQPPTEADRSAREDALATALAKELGIDAAKVKTALSEIRQERQAARFAEHQAELTARLDQAVKDGKLTRAEADAVLKAAKAGIIGFGGVHSG